MKGKCVIDMWNGEAYDKAKHHPDEIFWSDGSLRYWGWIYDANGEKVGDFTAETAQDAEQALGVTFIYT